MTCVDLQKHSQQHYSEAGAIAAQTLGAFRTVSVLNAQPDTIARYRQHLVAAMKVDALLYTCAVANRVAVLWIICIYVYYA